MNPPNPSTVTPYEACVYFVESRCARTEFECAGLEVPVHPCDHQVQFCPDIFFSEGANYTPEGIVRCVDQWKAATVWKAHPPNFSASVFEAPRATVKFSQLVLVRRPHGR